MDDDIYVLATLLYSSTVKTSFGFMGFMITKGIWFKLSVYYCFDIPKKLTITDAETTYSWELEKCEAKI